MGGELKQLFLFSNPFTMIFWLPGLFAIPLISKFKRYKLISFALCCSFVFLFFAKGKWYYFFPVVIGAIPLGTVFFERLLQKKMDNLRIPHRTRINRRLPLTQESLLSSSRDLSNYTIKNQTKTVKYPLLLIIVIQPKIWTDIKCREQNVYRIVFRRTREMFYFGATLFNGGSDELTREKIRVAPGFFTSQFI